MSWPDENLRNLERIRTLLPEKASASEIRGHLTAADGYLHDAANRTAREKGHRRIVFEALPSTCDAKKADSLALVHAHERRNGIDYAGDSAVSERETDDLIAVADRVRARLTQWMKKNRPDLLK